MVLCCFLHSLGPLAPRGSHCAVTPVSCRWLCLPISSYLHMATNPKLPRSSKRSLSQALALKGKSERPGYQWMLPRESRETQMRGHWEVPWWAALVGPQQTGSHLFCLVMGGDQVLSVRSVFPNKEICLT